MPAVWDNTLNQRYAPMDWASRASCAGMDPNLFFADKGGTFNEARETCHICPVVFDCLMYAIKTHQRFGLWGGMTYKQRTRFARSIPTVIGFELELLDTPPPDTDYGEFEEWI